ncbi:hypothetical protein QOZ80_2BG0172920 [Eleusine coracana subsp. coracana]|nr:hypothetical protein QOZ80_2BG0172920 [Eleusine coracana subsp. coracana]
MDSANHQWLQELEKDDAGELEFINPLSMQKLAESLANELWGQPPQEQHDNQQEHSVYPIPSLTGSSFIGDTSNTRATFSSDISNNMFSFTDGSSRSLNFTANEDIRQQSMTGTTTTKCYSPSTTVRGGGRRSISSVHEHVIAERKRREKMHHQFATLASIVPDITKTDKVSLLGTTIEYVHKLRDRLKALQDELQNTGSNTESPATFHSRGCIGGNIPNVDEVRTVSPKIEVDVQGTTVLLRVVCRKKKGVLVKVLMELEKHGISIVNTNVVPFAESSLNITITAQGGEIKIWIIKVP